jgi:hypothetical protein
MTTRKLEPWEQTSWWDDLFAWLWDDTEQDVPGQGWRRPCCQYVEADDDTDGR